MSENVGKVYNLSGYGKVLADIIHDLGEKVDQTALDSALQAKQNTLIGAAGQVVGFDEEGHAIATEAPKTGLTQEEADELYMPFEDPGFLGMLWSQGENGDTIEAMTEYDSGDGNKTSYLSIHREGASVDIGVSEGEINHPWAYEEKAPYSYATLYSEEGGGAIEMLASKHGGEITLRGKNNAGDQKTLTFTTVETPGGAFARLAFNPNDQNAYGSNGEGPSCDAVLDFIELPESSQNGAYNRIRVTGLAAPSENYDAVNKEYVDELCLPIEDPGFLGMLWSQDEEGNGIQVMAGYDDGSTKTTYITAYETGASADMGVISGDTPISYMTLKTKENGGNLEARAGNDYSELALLSPGGNNGKQKAVILAISRAGAGPSGEKPVHARLMFEDEAYASAKSAIDFYKRFDGKIRVAGLADPENSDEAANKEYVDSKIQSGTQAPSELEDGVVFLVYE